ncbi:MAG: zinc ABC transporter substrate-binding protein [Candidatus Zophobacter franzmannii]|nr:zinc ABC transporter substrate-binding protein [Candidatus Zophobacter franzmannii]
MFKNVLLFTLILIAFLTGCAKTPSSSKSTVFVSILPQKYFIERITDGAVDIEVMVKPGSSPAFYEPLPQQMSKLAKADAFYVIGVPFEQAWLKDINKNFPHLLVVDVGDGIPMRETDKPIEFMENVHREKHEHGRYDPHIWLDPVYAQKICANTYISLIKLYPQHTEIFRGNYDKLISDLQGLSEELDKKLSEEVDRKLLVFHPSWGYFADRYGYQQIPIEVDNKNPTAKETARIVDYALNNKIKYIFINEQVDTSQVEKIAEEVGARVVSIDPLAENYIENLRKVGDAIFNSKY